MLIVASLTSHNPCPVAVAISSYHKPSVKSTYAYEGPTVFGSPGAQFVYVGAYRISAILYIQFYSWLMYHGNMTHKNLKFPELSYISTKSPSTKFDSPL